MTVDLRNYSQQCVHCHQLVVKINHGNTEMLIDLEPGHAQANVAVYARLSEDADFFRRTERTVILSGNVVNPVVAQGMKSQNISLYSQHAATCVSAARWNARVIRPSSVTRRGARR